MDGGPGDPGDSGDPASKLRGNAALIASPANPQDDGRLPCNTEIRSNTGKVRPLPRCRPRKKLDDRPSDDLFNCRKGLRLEFRNLPGSLHKLLGRGWRGGEKP